MSLEINFEDFLHKKVAIVFDVVEDAKTFVNAARAYNNRIVDLWESDRAIESRYKSTQPRRFAVSFEAGFMQYMTEDYYYKEGFRIIEFASLANIEPILESDMLFSDLFKVM